MRSKLKAIKGSIHILAKILSTNEKATVVFGGRATCTDGQTIWMGELPPDHEAAADIAFGKLIHECEHVDSTDFVAYGKEASKSPFISGMLNCLEDIRIEQKRMAKYPGARRSLGKTVARLVSDGGFREVTEQLNEAQKAQSYVLYHLRRHVLGQEALDVRLEGAEKHFVETFGEPLKNRVDALMYDVADAASTSDVIRLCRQIVQAFEEAKEQAEQPPPPPQPQPQAQPQGDQGQPQGAQGQQGQSPEASGNPGDASQTGQGDPSASGDPQPSDSPQDSSQGDSGQGTDSGSGPTADASGNPGDAGQGTSQGAPSADQGSDAGGAGSGASDQRLADAIASALGAGAGDVDKSFDQMLADRLNAIADDATMRGHGTLGEPRGVVVKTPEDLSGVPDLISAVRAQTTALRTRIKALLQAETLAEYSTRSRGHKVDGSRVHRVATGNPRIFQRITDGIATDTAVYILVDRSGSMGRSIGDAGATLLSCALEASAALALSMEGVSGVDTSIGVFPYTSGGVGEVKPFGRGVRKHIATLASIEASGGTPMAEALLWAGYQLEVLDKPRKVVFVVTDGKPANEALCIDVAKDLSKMGIETMAIGIRTDAVRNIFENACVIQQVAELPKQMFRMLQDVLVGKSDRRAA